MKRIDGRKRDELRRISVHPDFVKSSLGSVLFEMGRTRVLCTANVEEAVPKFKENTSEGGWLSAEYGMLPGSSSGSRIQREASKGSRGGRTMEIQRLVGRALRACLDMKVLGERTIWVDCDVLEADGGTRTASISGGFIAMGLAVKKLLKNKTIEKNPIKRAAAAVSVGIVGGECLLDLNYAEDSSSDVDMNVVMTNDGSIVEIQGTAEKEPFDKKTLDKLLLLADKGIKNILKAQKEVLSFKF